MIRLRTTLIAAVIVLFPGCMMPPREGIPCRSKATGELVHTRQDAWTGWLIYPDANGIDQLITSSNSREWECRR